MAGIVIINSNFDQFNLSANCYPVLIKKRGKKQNQFQLKIDNDMGRLKWEVAS